MALSRCSSEPSLHSSSEDDMAFQEKPTRCISGYMEITLPTGDVWESSIRVQSDSLFGSGGLSQGKDEEIPGHGIHKTKSREQAFLDIEMIKSGTLMKTPSGVRTAPITQNAVPKDVILPADKVKSAIPVLVNEEWDVMSVCDQLIATGHMTFHTYRECHEMSKPKQGADYGRGLRREFLLYLAENPISWRALSAAMDKAGLTDIKQYLCPINQ